MPTEVSMVSVPAFLVAVLTGLLGFTVLVREHASRVSVAFFVTSLSVAVWLSSFFLVSSLGNRYAALVATRLVGAVGIAFIPSAVFLFAVEISGCIGRSRAFAVAGLVFSTVLYVAGAVTPWTIRSLYVYSWGFYPQYGPLSYVYLAFFATLMGASTYLLWRQYRRARTARQRRRMALLLVAAAIAAVACVDLLPVFGIDVYPFGYIAVFGSLLVVGRVVTRYRFVDITPAEMSDRIMEAMTDALCVVDGNGFVRLANEAAERMFHAEVINKPLAEIPGFESLRSKLQDNLLDQSLPRSLEMTDPRSGSTFSVSTSVVCDLQAEPYALLLVARDISERVASERNIQRQTEQLSALHAIDRAITGSIDPRLALNVLVEKAVEQLAADGATVFLYNEQANSLKYVAGTGLPTEMTDSVARIDGEIVKEVILERRIVRHRLDAREIGDSPRLQALAHCGMRTYHARPLVAKGRINAVLEVMHRNDFTPDHAWLSFFDALAEQAAIAVDNGTLLQELQRSNSELRLAYDSTLEGWALAMELRDVETQGHSERVSAMSVRLAETLGVHGDALVHLRRGALLHDIGKMGIPDSILFKKEPLEDDEWKLMQSHPVIAFNMLKSIPFLRPAIEIPYYHHERWDGSGYPRGLRGEEIPFAARIFSVVDVWDALRSRRPYHDPWPESAVREHLRSRSGKDFDPVVVAAFLDLELDDDNRERRDSVFLPQPEVSR